MTNYSASQRSAPESVAESAHWRFDLAPRDRIGEHETILPPRSILRQAPNALMLLVLTGLAFSVVTNPRYQWNVVLHYFVDPRILAGVGRTIVLTATAMTLGTLIGLLLAVMRTSTRLGPRLASWGYVWFFRATPILVQIILWYNIAALYPTIKIPIPFIGSYEFNQINRVMTPNVTIVLALSLYTGAYMAEIFRGGLLSVGKGQYDAYNALGVHPRHAFRKIILPQALVSMLPNAGNQFINVLKYVTLASVIGAFELLYTAQVIYAQTFETIPLLLVVALWYLLLVTCLTFAQQRLETWVGRRTSKTRNGVAR